MYKKCYLRSLNLSMNIIKLNRIDNSKNIRML